MEIFDFGRHTPFVLAAYGVSAAVIALLIIDCRRRLNKSLTLDQPKDAEK